MRRFFVVWILSTLLLSSCGQPASSPRKVDSALLASTTFLADITRNVTGDRVPVESLLPIGADPHGYQPTPQDAARIATSKLLIINGADYEHFLEPLLGAEPAGGERQIVEASAGISPREEAGNVDPHMWLDPNKVILYVGNIREALTHFDPDGAMVYQSNADAYVTELKNLDTWVVGQVNQIPVEKRLLVTNHEAMGYFAKRYGFTIVGTVVESFSSDASPSAKQLAALIDQIKASGAPAVFLDAGDNTTLAGQIADETGVRVVTDLHLESLTDGAPAGTYIDMMKYNVTQIVNALK